MKDKKPKIETIIGLVTGAVLGLMIWVIGHFVIKFW